MSTSIQRSRSTSGISRKLRANEHRRVRFEIERILDENRLSVAFQPIVDLNTRLTLGVEALSRVETMSAAPAPGRLFADGRAVGLGLALELRAVANGLARIGDLPQDAFLALNVSPTAACSEELAALVDKAPARVVLEVTEHAAVGDYHLLKSALGRMRAVGVRLAIDDVGAGFSSMTHTLELEPDLLKLDKALVTGIESDAARQALARSLVAYSLQIGATVVAEGIEREDEEIVLRAMGVQVGQGYHLGRPVPFAELEIHEQAQETAAARSVLVCEDQSAIRALLRATLADTGLEIIEAADGNRALELACSQRPDLILLDMHLPGRSGLEVLGEIRTHPSQIGDVPIVMLTASTQSDDRDAALAAGATAFVSKPFSPRALCELILRLLRTPESGDAAFATVTT